MFSHLTFDVPNYADMILIAANTLRTDQHTNEAVKGIIELIIMLHEAQESDRLP